jgi:hypothetical protein
MIPFASLKALCLSTDYCGKPANTALLAFGGVAGILPLTGSGVLMLGDDNQSAFSLPFNAIIEAVYLTVGVGGTPVFPGGITVYPFVQLFAASPGDNNFSVLSQTKTVPLQGFSGTAAPGAAISAVNQQINTPLCAGTRILIAAQLMIKGNCCLQRGDNFYYSGGIALRPVV